MNPNTFIGLIIFMVIVYLIRDILKNINNSRADILIQNIRTVGAVLLLIVLDIVFLSTDKSVCDLLPIFCN